MTIHSIVEPPEAWLADALESFERQFVYPLGEADTFAISHGRDYACFFRSMGDACCFVAERDGKVLATIGAAMRTLVAPDGRSKPVLYLGDLKIVPEARGGRILLRLCEAVRAWVANRTDAAFAVVMDGTRATPSDYSGRLGIPAFSTLARVDVLRVRTQPGFTSADQRYEASEENALRVYRSSMHQKRVFAMGGDATVRSEMTPTWLADPDGRAVGLLEDTRRGKRLHTSNDGEMFCAHLSHFGYNDIRWAASLIREALARAYTLGFPTLFTTVARSESDELCHELSGLNLVIAPATVYGTGLTSNVNWNINSSEI